MSSKLAKPVVSSPKKKAFNPDDYAKLSISKQEVLEIKRAFDYLDTDKDNHISPLEIKQSFQDLGLLKLKGDTVIYQVLNELDADHSGGVDFDEFFNFLTSKVSEKDSKPTIQNVYKFFDADDSGRITWNELKKVSQYLGEDMTDKEIQEMFNKADLDQDGFVDAEDFYNIFIGKGYY